MIHKLRKHTISLRNALNGVIFCLRTQPNFQIHIFFSTLALAAGLFLNISYYEFFMIIFLITTGLVIETINTAIEQATDAIDTRWREDIGHAKDIAAGAMLIFAVGASVISGIIFIPKIVVLFN
ncbi:MAG: diacylglycerol kinase family protein [Patescibacteria group bacterium]